VNAGTLFWLLRGRLNGVDGRRVTVALVKILIASIVMAIVAWGIQRELALVLLPGMSAIRRIVRVGLAVSGGLGTLVVMAKVLRLEEFDTAFGRVFGRLLGRTAK
jgi:peptidoglycan biosynthesis protein MviN/MurJ (putative lipid II flippase)